MAGVPHRVRLPARGRRTRSPASRAGARRGLGRAARPRRRRAGPRTAHDPAEARARSDAYRAWAAARRHAGGGLRRRGRRGRRAPLRPRLRAPRAARASGAGRATSCWSSLGRLGRRRPARRGAAPRRRDGPGDPRRQARLRHRRHDAARAPRARPRRRGRRADRGPRPRPVELVATPWASASRPARATWTDAELAARLRAILPPRTRTTTRTTTRPSPTPPRSGGAWRRPERANRLADLDLERAWRSRGRRRGCARRGCGSPAAATSYRRVAHRPEAVGDRPERLAQEVRVGEPGDIIGRSAAPGSSSREPLRRRRTSGVSIGRDRCRRSAAPGTRARRGCRSRARRAARPRARPRSSRQDPAVALDACAAGITLRADDPAGGSARSW